MKKRFKKQKLPLEGLIVKISAPRAARDRDDSILNDEWAEIKNESDSFLKPD